MYNNRPYTAGIAYRDDANTHKATSDKPIPMQNNLMSNKESKPPLPSKGYLTRSPKTMNMSNNERFKATAHSPQKISLLAHAGLSLFHPDDSLESVDNSPFEARRPAASPRDPEILLNTQSSCPEIDRIE